MPSRMLQGDAALIVDMLPFCASQTDETVKNFVKARQPGELLDVIISITGGWLAFQRSMHEELRSAGSHGLTRSGIPAANVQKRIDDTHKLTGVLELITKRIEAMIEATPRLDNTQLTGIFHHLYRRLVHYYNTTPRNGRRRAPTCDELRELDTIHTKLFVPAKPSLRRMLFQAVVPINHTEMEWLRKMFVMVLHPPQTTRRSLLVETALSMKKKLPGRGYEYQRTTKRDLTDMHHEHMKGCNNWRACAAVQPELHSNRPIRK